MLFTKQAIGQVWPVGHNLFVNPCSRGSFLHVLSIKSGADLNRHSLLSPSNLLLKPPVIWFTFPPFKLLSPRLHRTSYLKNQMGSFFRTCHSSASLPHMNPSVDACSLGFFPTNSPGSCYLALITPSLTHSPPIHSLEQS